MIYTLTLLAPRFALLGLAAVYVGCGHPWVALFPLGAFLTGLGCPRVP